MTEEEIYIVIFNKTLIKDRLASDSYTLGHPSVFGIPLKILLIKDKIEVFFDNEIRHVFAYNDQVELFYRKIEKPDGRNIQTDINKKTVRRRGRPAKSRPA